MWLLALTISTAICFSIAFDLRQHGYDSQHLNNQTNNSRDCETEKRIEFENQMNVLIREALHNFSKIMTSSDLENDTPVLDPLRVRDKNVTPAFGPDVFDVHFKNIKVEGLSEFLVNQVSTDMKNFRVKLSAIAPKVTLNTFYAVNGTLYDLFSLRGTGLANIEYTEVFLRTALYLDIAENKLQLAFADQPYVDFSSAQVKVNGRQASNRRYNELSHQVAPIVFWVFAEEVATALEPHLQYYLNAHLAKVRLPDFAVTLRDNISLPKVRVPKPIPYNYISSMHFTPVTLY
ncbi:uncharacterized protein LOC114828517 [Galendromus occidentalis]|uniref:Uncharacterized protein LOC114828517 n=1 Tax=Galendromus occidentalis TaxID=34638 RepID=A0AAJ7SHX4_9ACAR|nr:uncharacterized protein LOC114828517 [Galendromus occidentalis]